MSGTTPAGRAAAKVSAGQAGAHARRGGQRVVRLDDLSAPQRALVAALIHEMRDPASETQERPA
jgi:hypothetical protein